MIEDLVEQLRRETKFGAARLAAVLKADHGIVVAPVTVHRIMVRRGINRVADLDPPTGDQMRAMLRYEHDAPGAMVHVDVKKLGKIPTGGGWRIHGVGSDEHRASKRKGAGTGRIGTPTCTPRLTTTPGWRTPNAWKTRRAPRRQTSGSAPRRSSPSTASSTSRAA